MPILNVNIELLGESVFVGTITWENPQEASFSYSPDYLARQESAPVSNHLPLQKEPFPADHTRIFFEGLLPEGFTRKSVAQWMRVDENDYLSILAGLGKECLGAIRITAVGMPEIPPAYEHLSMEQVHDLAREGTTRSAELVTRSHLSLTGASGKVGLYYDPGSEEWYQPRGDAPSTHIVKQSHIRLDGIVPNEQLCLMTAARLGIKVPSSFIIDCGDSQDEDVLLATERYDRIRGAGRKIDGKLVPRRLHQEDFAQALGIASADKYEHAGDESYLKRMFDLLRRVSASPIQDQLALWDIIVFDYLVGNTDCHVKNCSLLYGLNLKTIRLAPAYDILSTSVYDSSTRDMAFRIGDEYSLDRINRDSFRKAASEIGLGQGIAMNHFDSMRRRFEGALDESAKALTELGFEKAAPIRQKILKNGGIANEIR